MKKLISILLCECFIFGFVTSNCYATNGKLFSSNKQLSNSLINHILQDKYGYIWIGTENGLNKYDGIKFTNYLHQYKDKSSLHNNFIRIIFEDSKRNLFIGTANGLELYDRKNDKFHYINILYKNRIIVDEISSIIERKNGDFIISFPYNGIAIIKKTNRENLLKNCINIDYFFPIINSRINAIHEDKFQNIWIGTELKGLFRLSKDYKIKPFNINNKENIYNISSICEDKQGNIYIGTLTNGAFLIPKKNSVIKKITDNDIRQSNITSLFYDYESNQVMIGSDGEGMYIYNISNNTTNKYYASNSPIDISRAKIHSITKDKDGNLWLGVYQQGAAIIPKIKSDFISYGRKSINHNIIGSCCVMSINKDSNGNLWIGTDNDGLYKVDEKKNISKHFFSPENPTLYPKTIMTIFEDSQKDIWVGTYHNGLQKMNFSKDKMSKYNLGKSITNRISFITEDKKQQLWIGTYGSGVVMINLKNNKITNFTTDNSSLKSNWINYIYVDYNENIWVGTTNGISKFDNNNKSSLPFNKIEILKYCTMNSIAVQKNGTIWVGTRDGLFKIIKKRPNRLICYKINKIPSEIICSIIEDKSNNIWITTQNGISKFNTQNNSFINYYEEDGLQSDEFIKNSFYQDKNGYIYIGGINGLTRFNPEQIKTYKKDISIKITDFYVGNRPLNFLPNTKEFILNNKDNSFSIDFSSFDFANQYQTNYQYRIKENGDEWINLRTKSNKISFVGMNYGEYHIDIRGFGENIISNTTSIKIIILPPWYLTWWAKSIWFIVFCIIAFFIKNYITAKYKNKKELLEHKHIEAIKEAKLQLFTNIAHDIRTPMTMIISPLYKLIEEKSSKEKIYKMMYRNANRILSLVNQLMDMRKIDNGQFKLKFRETDIVEYINEVMYDFIYQVQTKNIKFKFIHSLDKINVWIDKDNFDKILINIISNAFKYTPDNGDITIYTEITNNQNKEKSHIDQWLKIIVEDSGIGIDIDNPNKIFERFYQIENELNKSNLSTGVGLNLAKSIVLLHHGTIKVENRKDKSGSRFIIQIPMGCKHLKSSEIDHSENEVDEIPEIKKIPLIKEEQISIDNKQDIKTTNKPLVYIVDDEQEIRDYIKDELSSNFNIKGFPDGKQALEMILKERPNLVISDVMMPVMDGITLCKKVKENINVTTIPIILLTAKSNIDDNMQGISVGADAYIVKPFNTQLLKTIIINLINKEKRVKLQINNEQQQKEIINNISLKNSDEELLTKILKIINEHISDPKLNVNMLADNIGISRVHLHRKMRELTKQSTLDYIHSIRLKQAAHLFTENKQNISEVAYAVGFSNISHFSNMFKQFYGVTPSEYIEQFSKKN